MTQQRPCVFIDPQIDRYVEPAMTRLLETGDFLDRLAVPIVRILREVIIGPDLIGDSDIACRHLVPGAAYEHDVTVGKCSAQLLERRQADQEIAAVIRASTPKFVAAPGRQDASGAR